MRQEIKQHMGMEESWSSSRLERTEYSVPNARATESASDIKWADTVIRGAEDFIWFSAAK